MLNRMALIETIKLLTAANIVGFRMATSFQKLLQRLDMSELVGKELHDLGTDFVTGRLRDLDVLSNAVFAVCGAVTTAVAPLPADFDPADLKNFKWSGPTFLDTSIEWLLREIYRRNPDSSQFLVLVEDAWFKPLDMTDDDKDWYFPIVEDCLVYALPGDQLNKQTLTNLLRRCRSFFVTGFILDTTRMPSVAPGGIIARDVARHVKQTFIIAFDQDGLILSDWS